MEARAIPARRAAARRAPIHALLSDERLARLVSAGDERAFATLYERYHQALYRYCRSMLRHDADAQDALQAAMTGAYAALQRLQRDAPVRPWLFRIAHNESISVLRRRRPTAELTDDLGGAVASVEEHEERRARLALLLADLKELPERQRAALVMRELSGLSHEDIAIALDTSLGGAKQAIFEARRALSEFVEGRAMSCEEICRVVSDADGRMLRGRRVRAHLRHCSSCSTFAVAIPNRRADLGALAPPLPAIAAAGLLARVIGGSSIGGGSIGVGGGGAGLAGTLTSKGATLGLVTKAIAGFAVVSGATVGVTNAVEHAVAVHRSAGASTPVVHQAPTGAATKGAAGTRSSQIPGAPSASHRTNAAPAAAFGQQTSQTARSAVHGKSAVAPRGPAVGQSTATPPGQTVSATVSPAHGSGSNHGSTVSGSNHGSTVSDSNRGSTVSSTNRGSTVSDSNHGSTVSSTNHGSTKSQHGQASRALGQLNGALHSSGSQRPATSHQSTTR